MRRMLVLALALILLPAWPVLAAEEKLVIYTVEVVTFLGPVARLEVAVHGRPFWVDVAPGRARAYPRKKPLALAFDADDCVVIVPR
jgi:TOBE domain